MSEEKHRFTILIPREDIKDYIETDIDDSMKLVYHKPCYYNEAEWGVIEIEVTPTNAYDTDLEVLLNTYRGYAIHEEWSNCFCMLEEDVDDLEKTFCWGGAGQSLMSELMTPEEKLYLLSLKQTKLGIPGLVYGQKAKENCWENLQEKKDELFRDVYVRIRFGNIGEGEVIWWPTLIEELANFSFLIQSDDLDDDEDEENEKDLGSKKTAIPSYTPNPWDEEDDYYYHDPYDWGDY